MSGSERFTGSAAAEDRSTLPHLESRGSILELTQAGMAGSVEHDIGAFLRSRRARIQPESAGLPLYGRRRVPGLRREELAQLASVSVDYYVRLEQGRSPNVSDSVLDAIARALQLSDVETHHLHALAHPAVDAAAESTAHPQRIRPGLRRLLDMMLNVPAFVLGRRADILAWNSLGDAVYGFGALSPDQRNCARSAFLNPDSPAFYPDWETNAAQAVAYLCLDAGRHPNDPLLAALVEELSIASESFRRLWARHDVHEKAHGEKLIVHPIVGGIELGYEMLTVPEDPDQTLVIFTAVPGSESDQLLRTLGNARACRSELRLPPAVAAGPDERF